MMRGGEGEGASLWPNPCTNHRQNSTETTKILEEHSNPVEFHHGDPNSLLFFIKGVRA